MTIRYQGRKLGLDISRIFIDHDPNIIGHHRNALLTYEGNNNVYKPDFDMASKPNIDITQFNKYIFDDPLNININTPSSNFACQAYSTPTTLPKYRKDIQHGRVSHKDGNIPEEYHLTSFHQGHYRE